MGNQKTIDGLNLIDIRISKVQDFVNFEHWPLKMDDFQVADEQVGSWEKSIWIHSFFLFKASMHQLYLIMAVNKFSQGFSIKPGSFSFNQQTHFMGAETLYVRWFFCVLRLFFWVPTIYAFYWKMGDISWALKSVIRNIPIVLGWIGRGSWQWHWKD